MVQKRMTMMATEPNDVHPHIHTRSHLRRRTLRAEWSSSNASSERHCSIPSLLPSSLRRVVFVAIQRVLWSGCGEWD